MVALLLAPPHGRQATVGREGEGSTLLYPVSLLYGFRDIITEIQSSSGRLTRGEELLKPGGGWPCIAHVIANCSDGPVPDLGTDGMFRNSVKLPLYSFWGGFKNPSHQNFLFKG